MLVEAAKDATRLARLRYQGGSTGYLEVLTTGSNLYAAQLNLVNAQQGEALALVELYGALVGGSLIAASDRQDSAVSSPTKRTCK